MRTMAFSLIELMVVIAIVALLAAVAVPTYKNYVAKSQISTGFSVASPYINKAIMYYNTTGQFPVVSMYLPQQLLGSRVVVQPTMVSRP